MISLFYQRLLQPFMQTRNEDVWIFLGFPCPSIATRLVPLAMMRCFGYRLNMTNGNAPKVAPPIVPPLRKGGGEGVRPPDGGGAKSCPA